MKIAVIGTSHTKFGCLKQNVSELMKEAVDQAIKNSMIEVDMIDVIYIANFSSRFTDQCHLTSVLASQLGINREIVRVESACASGGLALKEATIALLSGLYKTVLVLGVEKMSSVSNAEAMKILASAASTEEVKQGASFPSLYALIAQRYFNDCGATESHLAKIAVKNHKNAFNNPLAQFHKLITVDDVLNSKVVASPLKLLDCSPVSDGAAAVVLTSKKELIKSCDSPIYMIGFGHDVEAITLYSRKDLTTMPAVTNAAKKAYTMGDITPNKIDIAEVHDCFTITELILMEELGFCEKGTAFRKIDEGRTEIEGELPINTSGGLKAKGHPVGATGISQAVEIVKQLRGDSGSRQIKNANIGLCCNIGGSGSSAVVSILSKETGYGLVLN